MSCLLAQPQVREPHEERPSEQHEKERDQKPREPHVLARERGIGLDRVVHGVWRAMLRERFGHATASSAMATKSSAR
jgi:hypothetical protein